MFRIILSCLFIPVFAWAVDPDQKTLPRGLAPFEAPVSLRWQPLANAALPPAPVHSLGEWEDAEAVFTLWPNASYIRALADRGQVQILSQSGHTGWWDNFLTRNQISSKNIHYVDVETDSIWVRDYGPWWILDGHGVFGAVDAQYNRPRPLDDQVPAELSRIFHFPLYDLGLVHTGGNYYSDGFEDAFSSTLVFKENAPLSISDVIQRMSIVLGINDYTTSALGVDVTIEHMDTFGKLVAPDTWVFSQFPSSSQFYADSERMVALLKTKLSPYGTPYKIYRLPMITRPQAKSREDYRAYINSFISNKVLYFPTYGDGGDDQAKAIYQQALPGYEIVGVESDGTEWGDSVHCRSRNLLKRDTIFAFPRITKWPRLNNGALEVSAEIFPTPEAEVTVAKVEVRSSSGSVTETMRLTSGRNFETSFRNQGSGSVEIGVFVKDSSGREKWFPSTWPVKGIEVNLN